MTNNVTHYASPAKITQLLNVLFAFKILIYLPCNQALWRCKCKLKEPHGNGEQIVPSVCVYYIMCILGESHQLDLRVGIYKNVLIYQASSNPIVSNSSSWSIDLLHKNSMFQLKSLILLSTVFPSWISLHGNEPRRYCHLILSSRVVDFLAIIVSLM